MTQIERIYMWLSLLIVPLVLLLDSKWSLAMVGLAWPTQLSFIFLAFLGIKRPLREAVWGLLLFAVLAHSQGHMSLSEILLPYLLILLVIHTAKKRLTSETYLFEAVWVMGLFFLFLCLQHLFYEYDTFFSFRFYTSLKLVAYTFVHGGLAFIGFIFWDWLFANVFERKKNF